MAGVVKCSKGICSQGNGDCGTPTWVETLNVEVKLKSDAEYLRSQLEFIDDESHSNLGVTLRARPDGQGVCWEERYTSLAPSLTTVLTWSSSQALKSKYWS